ncbi:MAG: hypothetical protein JO028_11315, partial [Acidobacteriaceae bacterium]|nr:hypothetical protein [Acidobacteriaceae bacterium]
MDTREKIIPLRQAKAVLDNGIWTVIVGLFDPLTASQARRIETCKRGGILVVVLENPDTLMPANARCHLVAALRSVNFVAEATEHEWRSVAIGNENIKVVDNLEEEKRRSQDFIDLVASR